MNTGRIENDPGLDLNDLEAVREAVRFADSIGHETRILAVYGDHLPACAVRRGADECDCGWTIAARWKSPNAGSAGEAKSVQAGVAPSTGETE